ncbi:glycine receptor subunit alpha-2-like isoform X1 [Haliotis asinina]|uniref:glycine receptor subunit alpha-2-like isoform X1 n=1 Tax=Haliotis asinina TaxID=109174 RepID=UPI0035324F41
MMLWRALVAIFPTVLTTLYLPQVTSQVHNGLSRRELLDQILKKSSYDPRIPPDYERDEPTNVTLQIHVLSFDSINEGSMDYSINIYLREKWTDSRLAFMNYTKSDWLELDTRMLDHVWVPDVYFQNEKKASFHNVTVPNRLIHLYRNGTVNYSLRLSMTLSCHMFLDRYPMDSQSCPIIIQSYTYTTDNVVFSWSPFNPITTNTNMELPQFNFQKYEIVECQDIYEKRFACIMANFKLKRDMGYFILQVYVPSVLIVILSWISFWIDIGAVPARISLGVLTVLTMTTQSSGAQSSLPRVSYVKAIDVWMSICLFFVFTALLEYAYVNVQTRRAHNHPERYRNITKSADTSKSQPPENDRETVTMVRKSYIAARQLDKFSRWIFPLMFILFNILYWCVYLHVD